MDAVLQLTLIRAHLCFFGGHLVNYRLRLFHVNSLIFIIITVGTVIPYQIQTHTPYNSFSKQPPYQINETIFSNISAEKTEKTGFIYPNTSKIITNEWILIFKDKVPKIPNSVTVIQKFTHLGAIIIKIENKKILDALYQTFKNDLVSITPNMKSSIIFPTVKSHTMNKTTQNHAQTPLIMKKVAVQDDILEFIGARELYKKNIYGTNVTIGIIDTGVDAEHDELRGKIIAEKSFVRTEYGYSMTIESPTDVHGHGTWVAGIAAGKYSGVAPNASIVSAKIIHDAQITGAGGGAAEETTAGLIAAIDWLIEQQVDVISISLGQYHNLPISPRQAIINKAVEKYGILVTVAAGNSAEGDLTPATLNNPGTSLSAITVAASDHRGTYIADFSSNGYKIDYSLKPDISAPGLDIQGPKIGTKSKNISLSGTSGATPIVAGASALLLSYLKKNKIPYNVGILKGLLLKTAKKIPNTPIWRQGAGFIQVNASFSLLNNLLVENHIQPFLYIHPNILPFPEFYYLFQGEIIFFNVTFIKGTLTNLTLYIDTSTLPTDVTIFPEKINLVNSSQLVTLRISVNNQARIGKVNQRLKLFQLVNGTSSKINFNAELLLNFEIRKPKIRILFDETHNRIVKRNSLSGFSPFLDVYGDFESLIGMFSEFNEFLRRNDILITPYVSDFGIDSWNASFFKKFDVFILPVSPSKKVSPFMDWVPKDTNQYYTFTQSEADSLHEYIKDGGNVWLWLRESNYLNKKAINAFLLQYGIQMENNYPQEQDNSAEIFIGTTQSNAEHFSDNLHFPFRGASLSLQPPKNGIVTSFATLSNQNTTIMAGYQSLNQSFGKVLVIGTDYPFDNTGLLYGYGNSQLIPDIISLIENSLEWLTNTDVTFNSTVGSVETPTRRITFITFIEIFIVISSLTLPIFYYRRKKIRITRQ